MREWKPGDVAMVITEGGERVGFRCGTPVNMGWQYAREPGQNTWSADGSGYVKPIRPLVVIDPEDREQVERLVREFLSAHPAWGNWENVGASTRAGTTDAMRAALRSLVEPPRPAEPTGLGAVVRERDDDGLDWVRVPLASNDARWFCGDTGEWRCYADINVVRVLSEGVTP